MGLVSLEANRETMHRIVRGSILNWAGYTILSTLEVTEGHASSETEFEVRAERGGQALKNLSDRCRGNRPEQAWLTEFEHRRQFQEAVMRWVYETLRDSKTMEVTP